MDNNWSKTDKLLLWALCLLTITVTPFVSYDPINLPRFLILTVFGLILFSILIFKKIYLSNFKNNLLEHEKIDLLILALIFIVIFNQKTESAPMFIAMRSILSKIWIKAW
jgi:hypothetical protein